MDISLSTGEILDIIGEGNKEGSTDVTIKGIAALDMAGPGDLSFLGNNKYRKQVPKSCASLVLLPEDYIGKPGENQQYLRVRNPSLALSMVCEHIELQLNPSRLPGIDSSAVIDSTASIDLEASIGPQCVVEAGAVIGKGTVLEANVYIGRNAKVGKDCRFKPQVVLASYCEVGDRVRLHAGVVVGSDGFGYDLSEGVYYRNPQIGYVIVEDDVEIGANTTVDRARFNVTRIQSGTKIDNLVQVAHNVNIGKNCIIAAQSGISGSTTLEDEVTLAGQVGVAGHITIGRGAIIGAQGGVNRDIEPSSTSTGTPVMPLLQARKIDVLLRKLPELFKKVANIEKIIEKKSVDKY